jgi:hypothetical protein
MVMRAKAALGGDGKIADWEYEVWSNSHSTRPESTNGTNVLAAWYLAEPQTMGPPTSPPQPAGGGDRNAIPLYDFPSQRVIHHFVQDMPIRVSALRTLGAYSNVFALESFMTSSPSRRRDPIAFRLTHMKDPVTRGRSAARKPVEGRREGVTGRRAAASGLLSTRTSPATSWWWPESSRPRKWRACRGPGRRSMPPIINPTASSIRRRAV